MHTYCYYTIIPLLTAKPDGGGGGGHEIAHETSPSLSPTALANNKKGTDSATTSTTSNVDSKSVGGGSSSSAKPLHSDVGTAAECKYIYIYMTITHKYVKDLYLYLFSLSAREVQGGAEGDRARALRRREAVPEQVLLPITIIYIDIYICIYKYLMLV